MILRDAESFHEASIALEQIGKVLSGEMRPGLGRYKSELLELMELSGDNENFRNERIFNIVKDARNMAVHEGAFARHLSSRFVDVFLIIERAIMSKINRVEDIMVRSPICAENWHMIGHARREMLAGSYSFLPILYNGKWCLISDIELMKYLNEIPGKCRNERLSMRLDLAIKNEFVNLIDAKTCLPTETIAQLLEKMDSCPILVVKDFDGEPVLLGIVTPFDLL